MMNNCLRPASYADIEEASADEHPLHGAIRYQLKEFWEPLYCLYLAEWRKRGFLRCP